MPLPGQRDPGETRAALAAWLARQMPPARDIEIPWIEIPQSSGFSNETFLFDAVWSENGAPQRREFVLRAQPRSYALFPHIDVIAQQFRTMKLLARHSDVPVAPVFWAEPDPAVLDQPFFVMQRVSGEVPGDNPPYTKSGFIMELAPAERRALYQSGLEALTRVHRVNWRAHGFECRARARYGPPGPRQLHGYFAYYRDWACEGKPHPVIDPAWRWLESHWPEDGGELQLTWGDARIGNQIFHELRCVAVLDWEMTAIANAVSDLGWWLYMQRFHTDGMEAPLPEGFFTREEVIAFWEQCLGRRAEHIEFYEILGGFHFSLIMVALARNVHRLAPDQMPADFGVTNPGPRVLAAMLNL